MSAPLNFRKKRLADFDKYREGTFVKKIPANPQDLPEQIEKGYHIEFVPDQDMFISWLGYAKLLTGVGDVTVVTEDIYSENAIIETNLPWHDDTLGTPEEVIVLLQNVNEEAKLMEEVENRKEAKLEMLERKLGDEKRKRLLQEAENIARQGSQRAASDEDEPRRRRDRRNRDSDRKNRKNSRGRRRDEG